MLRRRFRERLLTRRLYASWRALAALPPPVAPGQPGRLLIVPCEPWQVIGSRGDEAMIVAAIRHLQRRGEARNVAVITADPAGSEAVRRMGFEPLEVWRGADALASVHRAGVSFDPRVAIVLGADVMDGYYSPVMSLMLLAMADLLVRRGVAASLLGFSFNSRPSPSLRRGFRMLDPRTTLNVRDPVSFDRLRRFVPGANARLVADTAFLLEPDPSSPEFAPLAGWVQQRRAAGDVVLAVNVHPMLIRHATPAQIGLLADDMAAALTAVGRRRCVSYLLLPHDYREHVGDNLCLEPIHATLSLALPGRVRHLATPQSAAQLKALVGFADGLVSSRMHLLIAALGQGLPVAAFHYQDKFEGLFRHFELPAWLLFDPLQPGRRDALAPFVERFLESLEPLRRQVTSRLPAVLSLAGKNLTD